MTVRHEFYDAIRPQYPMHLPLGVEFEVLRTTVLREETGRGPCADDPVVVRYYVRSIRQLAAERAEAEAAQEELASIGAPNTLGGPK